MWHSSSHNGAVAKDAAHKGGNQVMTEVNRRKPSPLGSPWVRGGGIVLVLAVLVAGGLAWHEDPSFCGICHTPMKTYIEGYRSGDKTLMITQHATAKADLKCLDCHEQTVRQEATELLHWVTGNYEFPLQKREIGTRQFCLASGCHDENKVINPDDAAKIVQASNPRGDSVHYNQHDPRHGKQECSRCHSMHGKSVLMCNQCHRLQLRNGWVSPQIGDVRPVS